MRLIKNIFILAHILVCLTPMKQAKRNIFCLEGLWDHNNVNDASTIHPILDLLAKKNYCEHIYHKCATKEELEFYLRKWKQKGISRKYPILYLAFHGEPEHIFLTKKERYSMKSLGDLLEGSCSRKVIHFGSCSTLKMDKRNLQNFLEKTRALAAIGYKKDIDWMLSAACDLLIFEALQNEKVKFDYRGINSFTDLIFGEEYGKFPKSKLFDLRIEINKNEINKKIPAPRKRSIKLPNRKK